MLLWCMLSGRESPWPLAEVSGSDFEARVLGGERPDCSLLRPDAPPALVAVIKRAWVHDPASRPSAAEVLAILTDVLVEHWHP
jgi:hypothetical protein